MVKIASLISFIPFNSLQSRRVFEIDPPIDGHRYIAASDIQGIDLDETMVFTCNEDGAVNDWAGLVTVRPHDHIKALDELGYVIGYLPSWAEIHGLPEPDDSLTTPGGDLPEVL